MKFLSHTNPIASSITGEIRRCGPDLQIVTQVLTGHGGFLEYLHRFKIAASPLCPCAGGAEESILHILCECPMHGLRRFDTEQTLDVRIYPGSLHEIVEDEVNRKIFLKFAIYVAKQCIQRNKT